MATETTPGPEAPQQEAPQEQKTSGSTISKARPSRSSSKRKAAPRKAAAKKTSVKKSAAKSGSAKKATSKRTEFPAYKTEAACEKVMKDNLASYKQYQVERDKNRNEKGMEKHRLGYRTYKNAYTQLLALRKASGKGRRNAKDNA